MLNELWLKNLVSEVQGCNTEAFFSHWPPGVSAYTQAGNPELAFVTFIEDIFLLF